MSVDLALELSGLHGCGFDSAGEAAEHEPARELVERARARASKSAAADDQPPGGQLSQLLAQTVGTGDDHAAQLHERIPADVDGAAACKKQQP